MCFPLRLTETRCSPTSLGVNEIPWFPLGSFLRKHGSSMPDGETMYALSDRRSYSDKFSGRLRSEQVLPLTQFLSVCFFLQKIINLLGGQINDSSSGKYFSLPFLPATPSSLSWTLEGLFELTRRPSRALDSPALLPELQRNKDTVRCAALGTEVP